MLSSLLQALYLLLRAQEVRTGIYFAPCELSPCCSLCLSPAQHCSCILTAAPCSAGSGSGGITAKDALGNDVKASTWIKKYGANSRSLTQGLKVRTLHGRQAAQAWGVHLEPVS